MHEVFEPGSNIDSIATSLNLDLSRTSGMVLGLLISLK